jgi:hypothetical protein
MDLAVESCLRTALGWLYASDLQRDALACQEELTTP